MAAGRLLLVVALVATLALANAQDASNKRGRCINTTPGTAPAPTAFTCVTDSCGNPVSLFGSAPCTGTPPYTAATTPLNGLITSAKVWKSKKRCGGGKHGRRLSQDASTWNRGIGSVTLYYADGSVAATCGGNGRGIGRKYSFTCNGGTGVASFTPSCNANGALSFTGSTFTTTTRPFVPVTPSPSPKVSPAPSPSPKPSPSPYYGSR